ncbi:MAG: hypothetical protein ABR599_07400 [Gemmatimonadota bacterium]
MGWLEVFLDWFLPAALLWIAWTSWRAAGRTRRDAVRAAAFAILGLLAVWRCADNLPS